ncbi:thiol reductant ABC exporter subunit CydC [Periweissella cryptocerci]|uniref:Thiol reductant ABC exporter subunit CydC n=1 Tax=Periweissella cryptocerci TaxID=2506420 RepID=A0A4P6YT69_9LACO|nr:thiol reductant ABC exporter subunit CydC [Periweissella cryptocerci]QBO35843.1 thiol reductant ABC exporter subunit CydC [Periweissella cryptocerci]
MHDIIDTFAHDSWVLPYLKRYKGLLLLVIFLGFMTFFCGSALMFTSGYLISRAAQRPENILLIYVPIVLTRAFGIGRPAFRYAQRLTSHNWVLRIVSDFRKKLYLAVEKTAVTIRQERQTGDILAVLADDIEHIENLYLRTIFPVIIGWLLYIVVTVAIGGFNWAFGLLMFLLFGMITIVIPLISVAVNGARVYKTREIQHDFYVGLTDSVLGLADWVIAGRQKDLVANQDQPIEAQVRLRRQDHHFTWWRDFTTQMFVGIITIVMLVFADVEFGGSDKLVNWIAAFTLAIFPTIDAFQGIAQGFTEWPSHQASIRRVNDFDHNEKTASAVPQVEVVPNDFTALNINDVTFQYENGKAPAVSHLNLQIKKGEKLAILGPSGAGKSTLLKLLLGDLTATDGQILVNDIDVAALQTHRAELFGVLDQQPYLFNSTVMNNVRLGNLAATDEQVIAAVEAVGLGELVAGLPDGYQTAMSEGGNRFSGGERQRFALARILLQDAPIIILDEPTVSLDPITEAAILATIFKLFKDKTIIWVTHHLMGVKYVDQVRFIENGQFEMVGSPAELYQTEPRFKKLLDLDRGLTTE